MRGLRSIKRSLAPVQACRASFGNCCLVQMQCTGLLLIATRRKLMQSASLADAAASPGNSLDQSLHNSHAGLHLQHNAPAGGLNACQNGLLLQHGQRDLQAIKSCCNECTTPFHIVFCQASAFQQMHSCGHHTKKEPEVTRSPELRQPAACISPIGEIQKVLL